MDRFDIFVRGLTPPIFFWISYALLAYHGYLWDLGVPEIWENIHKIDGSGTILVSFCGALIISTGYILHQISAFVFFGHFASLWRESPQRLDPYVRMVTWLKISASPSLHDEQVEGALAEIQSEDRPKFVEWFHRKWSIVMNNNDLALTSFTLSSLLLVHLYCEFSIRQCFLPAITTLVLVGVGLILRSEAQRQRQVIFEAHRTYLRKMDVSVSDLSAPHPHVRISTPPRKKS